MLVNLLIVKFVRLTFFIKGKIFLFFRPLDLNLKGIRTSKIYN
jgi:hypothetical protein